MKKNRSYSRERKYGEEMKRGLYYEKLNAGWVKCTLCPHRCKMNLGDVGKCSVRKNENGALISLNYGRISGLHMDPIEKKPIHFYLKGTETLSVGSFGCNLSCPFCQNHLIAQSIPPTRAMSPEEIVEEALLRGAPSISYTYNEPTVFYEMVLETARLAKKKGLKNILVTNGYMENEPLKELIPYIDGANIDLKGFNSQVYREVFGGDLDVVKRNIVYFHQNLHLEVTTLVVTGINDRREELISLFHWLASISPDIPLHLNRYYPSYQYHEAPTDIEFLLEMKEEAGKVLNNVRCGNF